MYSSTRGAGFSLIELVIVVAIIAVISAIAIPRLSRGAEGASLTSFNQTYTELAKALERYKAEHGVYPPVPADSSLPPEIQSQFYGNRALNFSALGGGSWKYMLKSHGCVMVCAVFTNAPSASDLQQLDELLDDGDLTTGDFIQFNTRRFDYCLK